MTFSTFDFFNFAQNTGFSDKQLFGALHFRPVLYADRKCLDSLLKYTAVFLTGQEAAFLLSRSANGDTDTVFAAAH